MNANWLKATRVVLVCLAVSASEATEYRWVGGSTGQWNVSANWDPAGTPTGGDTVVFTNATTVTDDIVLGEGMLVLTNTASAVHLKGVISGAGGIDKGGGGALHLYGNNTFAGKLISTGTGKTYAGYGVTSEIDHGSSEIIVYHPHAFGNAGSLPVRRSTVRRRRLTAIRFRLANTTRRANPSPLSVTAS